MIEHEAMRWDGGSSVAAEIVAWIAAKGGEAHYDPHAAYLVGTHLEIAVRTINGWVGAAPGDSVHFYKSTQPPTRFFTVVDHKTFMRRLASGGSRP